MTINDSIPLYLHPTNPHRHRHHRPHTVMPTPEPHADHLAPILSGAGGGAMHPQRGDGRKAGGSNPLVFHTDVLLPTDAAAVPQGGQVEEVVVHTGTKHDTPNQPRVDIHPYLNYPGVDADPFPPYPKPDSQPFPNYPGMDTHPYPAVNANPYEPNYPGVNVNPYHPGDLWEWGNGSLQLNMTVWGGGAGGEEDRFNWGILVLAPLVVFGIAGNTLVILAISLERRLQNVTNYFLLSLAVTDLLVSLIVMPFSIINEFTVTASTSTDEGRQWEADDSTTTTSSSILLITACRGIQPLSLAPPSLSLSSSPL